MLPNAAQQAVGLLCHKSTLLPHVQLVHQQPQRPFLQSCFPADEPPVYPGACSLFLPRCGTLHFSFLNLMRCLLARFSCLSRSTWTATQPCGVAAPPSFVYSANLVRVHSAPPPVSLKKMLSEPGSSINPWSMPLEPCLQLDFLPLVTALWGSSSAGTQSPHWPFIYPVLDQFVYEDIMGDRVESPAEIKTNNNNCSAFIHWASHVSVKGCQGGQAWFPLNKSMVLIFSHLLIFCMFINGF